MRDGTSYVGTVASSSPTELTITGDDKATRTLAMKDVKSIEYDEAVSTPAPAASTPAPAEPRRPAVAAKRPRPDISHENHPHPVETAISTKITSTRRPADSVITWKARSPNGRRSASGLGDRSWCSCMRVATGYEPIWLSYAFAF